MNHSHYKVIADPGELKKFIDWLPDLTVEETFYVALLARNKYSKHLNIGTFNSDRHQCARFLTTKERLFTKIHQTEAPLDSYRIKEATIPQEALACYMNVNPRNQVRAQGKLLEMISKSLVSNRKDVNLYQDAMSAVHKTVSRKVFIEFDVDGDDINIGEYAEKISKIINPECVSLVMTRGGFHILVKASDVDKKYVKSWYNNIRTLPGIDQVGDAMTPIPGTYQGMFIPRLLPLSYFL